MSIYLDNFASTPLDPRISQKIKVCFDKIYGNYSSKDHFFGEEAQDSVETTRQKIAAYLHAAPSQIIFTSGATEAINIILQGYVLCKDKAVKIAYSPIEHKAVLDVLEHLHSLGRCVLYKLKVDTKGRIDLDYLYGLCKNGMDLLCTMAVNNELGNINPIHDISLICRETATEYFVDASQAIGRIDINFKESNIAFLIISGHKIYGPKGVGAVIAKTFQNLSPILYGGVQERGLRPGTLNVPAIVALGEAIELRRRESLEDESRIAQIRDAIEMYLREHIPNLTVNGDTEKRVAGALHISIPDLTNKAVIARFRDKLAISTGAACASGVESPSHVLKAIGLNEKSIEGAFRLSVGKFNSIEEVDEVVHLFVKSVEEVHSRL